MSPPSARPPYWFLVTLWLLIVGAFALGMFVARRTTLPEPQATALQVVLQEIARSHVDEQDPGKLLDYATKKLASFDHYGQYVPVGEVDDYVEATTGNYVGIGVATLPIDGHMLVRFPFAGGPAEQAGLLPGDEIVAVDGDELAQMTAADRLQLADKRIRGEPGTKVQLAILRDSARQTLTVERAAVHKPCAKWAHLVDAEQGIGYLWLSDFHPGADAEIARAIDQLADAPGGLRGLVLDLRFDGGGYLDACIAIANLFVAEGTIVTVRGRGNVVEKLHAAERARCRFPDLPLAVLVDRDSASASEVLAGALQDHRRATIVGELTYGKGMVNTVFSYQRLAFKLKVTTGRYYTPNGRNLEGHFDRDRAGAPKGGIEPDRAVPLADAPRLAVYTALQEQEPPTQYRAAVAALLQQHKLRVPGIQPASADAQLAAAIAAVRERMAGAAKPAEAPAGGTGK